MPVSRYIGDDWSITVVHATTDGTPIPLVAGETAAGTLYRPSGQPPVTLDPTACTVSNAQGGELTFAVARAITATLAASGEGVDGALTRLQAVIVGTDGTRTTAGLAGIIVLDPQSAPAA